MNERMGGDAAWNRGRALPDTVLGDNCRYIKMEANMMNTDDKHENAGCILAKSSF